MKIYTLLAYSSDERSHVVRSYRDKDEAESYLNNLTEYHNNLPDLDLGGADKFVQDLEKWEENHPEKEHKVYYGFFLEEHELI